jgi:hypothetical protein
MALRRPHMPPQLPPRNPGLDLCLDQQRPPVVAEDAGVGESPGLLFLARRELPWDLLLGDVQAG